MKSRSISILVLVIITIIGIVFPSIAKEPIKKITGVYTNMWQDKETYDIVGMELFIVKGANGYFALFQIAEGGPGKPILVQPKIDGNHIEFTVPGDSNEAAWKFKGVFMKDGIEVKSGNLRCFLKRKKSFWQ